MLKHGMRDMEVKARYAIWHAREEMFKAFQKFAQIKEVLANTPEMQDCLKELVIKAFRYKTRLRDSQFEPCDMALAGFKIHK